MSVNELSLEVASTTNCKVMRLYDTSNYCDDAALSNYIVEVLAPTKSKWAQFHVVKEFSLVLNSSSVLFQKVTDKTQLVDMPDGIYEIKQSYKPNIHTLVHFYHMRVCILSNKLQAEFCKLICDECKLSREEFYRERDKLREIEEYISASKYMVEEKLKKAEGKELYQFAEKLLEDYGKQCKC